MDIIRSIIILALPLLLISIYTYLIRNNLKQKRKFVLLSALSVYGIGFIISLINSWLIIYAKSTLGASCQSVYMPACEIADFLYTWGATFVLGAWLVASILCIYYLKNLYSLGDPNETTKS